MITRQGEGDTLWTGQVHTANRLTVQGGPDPAYPRGGSRPVKVISGPKAGTHDGQGPIAPHRRMNVRTTGLFARYDGQGPVLLSRLIDIDTVYRNGDRVTLAGYARDLAGQPLRAYQIQFIGRTVQDSFFGSSTNLNGVFIAYLEQGDEYAAYAFSPTTGITYKLETREDLSNQTNLTFRQITKRGGYSEGIFLQGGG